MSEATTTPTVGRVPAYLVSSRSAWSDPWVVVQYVYPSSIQLSAAPSISRATLIDNYGTIARESASSFSQYDPIDLKDQFIKIESVDDPADPQTITALFYGYVPSEELLPHKSRNSNASGDYTATAYGLDYLLDVSNYAASWVASGSPIIPGEPSPPPAIVGRVLPFNERYTFGLTPVGNRSKDKIDADEEVVGSGHYVFSDDNYPWTARDICEYTLKYYTDPRLTFTLGGQADVLDNVIPSNFNPDMMTAQQVLNAMIDRRRGAGWRVKVTPGVAPDPDEISVEVFSLLGADVSEGPIIIPANVNPIAINLDTLADIEDVSLNIETVSEYDRIVARGARVKTVLSMRKATTGPGGEVVGGIIPAWSTTEENAYKIADDNQRDSDAYRHIYTTFTMPDNAQLNKNSNPVVDDSGVPDFGTQANMRSWGYTFLRQLPIIKTWADKAVMPEYREPFAFVKDPGTGQYHYADRLNTIDFPSLTLRMLDSQPGFELMGHYNHILGLNHFTGESAKAPLFDYDDLWVTVAMETDSHLRYAITLADPSNRVLTIDVPDAELWILSNGTATDINADGTLKVETVSSVLRTDADRLRGIATVARAWYGVRRGSLNMRIGNIVTFSQVGDYIVNTISGNYTESVESVVSQVTYDCINQTTTIQTAYEELDFQRLDR